MNKSKLLLIRPLILINCIIIFVHSLSVLSVPATELEQLKSEIKEKETDIDRLTVLVENSQEELKSIGDIMVSFMTSLLGYV